MKRILRSRPGLGALVFFLALLCSVWGHSFEVFAAGQKVLNLSDIHFNPFYEQSLVSALRDAPASAWKGIFEASGNGELCSTGQETNYALLDSSLEAMAQAEPDPDFILLTGDMLSHHFSDNYQKATGDQSESGLRSFIKKTVSFMADMVSGTFQGTTVYYILGNNDAYNGDYQVAPEGQFLKDASRIVAEEFLPIEARQEFIATFGVGGYYSLALPEEGTRVIGLNSNFFSTNYVDPGETRVDYDPGLHELAWLESELAKARAGGEKVMLLCHIPPGTNVYGTIHNPQNSLDTVNQVGEFWQPQYLSAFLDILGRHYGTIKAVYSGHTHMDDFRLFFLPGEYLQPVAFVHIVPAISPQFGNNPGFKILEIESTSLAITDTHAYYLDLAASSQAWSLEYSFNQAFGQKGVNIFSLNWLHGRMAWDAKAQGLYMDHYNVSNLVQPFAPSQFRAYWTGISCLTPERYKTVYNSSPDAPKKSQSSATPLTSASAWVTAALAAP